MSAVQPILVPREIVNADAVFVVKWLVEEGAHVEAGDDVCEIDTSKAITAIEPLDAAAPGPGVGHQT